MTTTIAFASCSHIDFRPQQPAWNQIAQASPDLLLLLGDTVYMTYEHHDPFDFARLDALYRRQVDHPAFKALVKQVPTMAIWDDHDFGTNNCCGASHPVEREQALALFRQHMAFRLTDHPERVYASHVVGDVKVIMLDVRYWRQPVSAVGDGSSLLGAEQEDWLWRELDHDRRYTVVGSGSTIAKGEFLAGAYAECVAHYEPFFTRLKQALHRKGRALFLSGDIHYNTFDSHPLHLPATATQPAHDVVACHEATSSGAAQRVGDKKSPVDNWGLITFGDDHVDIDFHGNWARNRFRKTIRADDWSVLPDL